MAIQNKKKTLLIQNQTSEIFFPYSSTILQFSLYSTIFLSRATSTLTFHKSIHLHRPISKHNFLILRKSKITSMQKFKFKVLFQSFKELKISHKRKLLVDLQLVRKMKEKTFNHFIVSILFHTLCKYCIRTFRRSYRHLQLTNLSANLFLISEFVFTH